MDPELSQLIQALPELEIPAKVSVFPLAIGWWLVIAFILFSLVALFLFIYRNIEENKTKRLLIKLLIENYQLYKKENDKKEYLIVSNQLLRRYCQQKYSQTNLTRLSGKSWLQALDNLIDQPCLNNSTGEALINIYKKQLEDNINIENIQHLLLKWAAKTPVSPLK